MLAQYADILSWILLTSGGAFVLIGGIGALRFPDVYTRMHAASVTDTLAAFLILFGHCASGWFYAGRGKAGSDFCVFVIHQPNFLLRVG